MTQNFLKRSLSFLKLSEKIPNWQEPAIFQFVPAVSQVMLGSTCKYGHLWPLQHWLFKKNVQTGVQVAASPNGPLMREGSLVLFAPSPSRKSGIRKEQTSLTIFAMKRPPQISSDCS